MEEERVNKEFLAQENAGNGQFCQPRISVKHLLAKLEPHSQESPPESIFVQELLQKGLPKFENGYTVPEDLQVNGLYRIQEWTVCLVDKKPNSFHFTSIERHFEDGHLHFLLDLEQVASKVVAPDDIFCNEAEVISFLEEEEEGELASGISCCHSRPSSSEGSETVDPAYWDHLFSQEPDQPTEWLVTYQTIRTHLLPFIQHTDQILVIGCGNSDLSVGLYEDDFTAVTSMDVSSVVVEQMRHKFQDKPEMKWDVEDVLNMSYESDVFDIVLDKSLMDCIFHCSEAESKVSQMVAEVHRVLRKGTAIALFLTIQSDDHVMPILENPDFGTWLVDKIELKVETDCEGRVPKQAVAVMNDEEFEYTHFKAFNLYVCRALSDEEEYGAKRQR